MAELPSGTVTFLFTDIEGSTRLLHELGDRYADVLAEHRRVLRKVFAAHGGVEVDTQGDAFFVAFGRASDALATAKDAQRALARGPVRVRIGVHTGEPTVTDEGYVGMDVHRAARVMGVGHGGQVLVSETAARLLEDVVLRDLGEHRLKDLGAPMRLFQLGDDEFPPLKSLNATNLPVQPTPFLGRERELAEVLELLGRKEVRVLTLTGAGGSGKTRLALQAAAERVEDSPHGVWWVPLQAVTDPALVVPTIGQTLGSDDLSSHVGDRRMLLVLDNLEQVVEAAPELADVLARCPNLRLLATSREPLHLEAEQEYAVPPLAEQEAVGFFLARARSVDPRFSANGAVRQLCVRLDCLPLALELAAARVKLMSPERMLARLGRALPLLTSGRRDAPARQRTLRSAIEWSYDLLGPEEQRLFARLSVFAGGWTLEAAEDVCDAELDVLQSLVDKSLVRLEDERFRMLETIREYSAERFAESGEADEVYRRHAKHLLALALSANLTALSDGEQDHELVAREHDNLRAALEWTLESGEFELGLRLAVAAENFWVATTSPFEGYRWLRSLLERAEGKIAGELRADALRSCASVTYIVGEFELGTSYIEESLAEYRRLGHERGTGHMLMRLAVEANRVGDNERARALATESLALARRSGHRRGEPTGLSVLASAEFAQGRPERGMELLERGAAIAREIGFTWWEAGTLVGLAEHAVELERFDDAEGWARASLTVARRIGDRLRLVLGIALLAVVAARAGRPEVAGRLWGALEAEESREPTGRWEEIREEFAEEVARAGGREFERGREEGRRLTLDAAAALALEDDDA